MLTIEVEGRKYAAQGVKDADVKDPEALIDVLKNICPHPIVLLNARFVAGRRHLELLLRQTVEAEKRGLLYARQREIDFMARVACETQLKKAVDKVGLRAQRMDVAAVLLNGGLFPREVMQLLSTLGTLEDSVIDLNEGKTELLVSEHNLREMLRFTPIEEDALAYLMAEKAALLACEYDF